MALETINPLTWQEHAWRNRFQSLFLLGLMLVFSGLLGYLLFGRDGISLIVLIITGLLLISPRVPVDLLMRMYRAEKLLPEDAPSLYQHMALLAKRAGLRRIPDIYFLPSPVMNAFAVGSQRQSAIGLTSGLLKALNNEELSGVLAHEISHIRSNDIWVMGIADLFSRITSILSLIGQVLVFINLPLILYGQVAINWWAILLLIFAPNISALAQLALSRTREFDADLKAAKLIGNPTPLVSALTKIEGAQGHWFERIMRPNQRVLEPSILRTHPRLEERIQRLMELKNTYFSQLKPEIIPPFLDAAISKNYISSVTKPRRHMSGLWY